MTGVSDNSALTNHAFLVTQKSKYKIIKIDPENNDSNYVLNKKSQKSKTNPKKMFHFNKEELTRMDYPVNNY